jgi:hypothetical protein
MDGVQPTSYGASSGVSTGTGVAGAATLAIEHVLSPESVQRLVAESALSTAA